MQLVAKVCSFDFCFFVCYCELSKSSDGLKWKMYPTLAQSSGNTTERYNGIHSAIRVFLRLLSFISPRDKILSLDEPKRCDSVPQYYAVLHASLLLHSGVSH